MTDITLQLVGPTYTNRSLPVSSQVTRNFYIEINQQGNETVTLQPFPGLKLFATAGSLANRGMGRLNDVLYTVSGTELYEIDSNGNETLIGTIPGTNRIIADEDGTNLIIAVGDAKPYQYNGTTLSQGTDADLPNANSATFINSRMVYDTTQGLAFADLSDPLVVNSANIATAESKPDGMLRVLAHKQQVYAYGTKSIEPWYFSGSGSPPYDRITNAVQEIGLGATYSIGKNKNFMYFLGSDLMIYRIAGLEVQAIGNPAIGQAIAKYAKTDDAYGVAFALDNQEFYMITFPTGDETWLFNESASLWTNLAFGTDGDRHLISDYQFIYGKHLVSDRRNGNIYELDFDTYTDNTEVIQRRRDTLSINGETFGRPGSKVFMNHLQLVIEPGVSLVSAESQIIMQYSDDNGRTFSSERFASIGQQGDYTYKVEWWGLGDFYNRMFRFTMSDPIKWTLISLNADVEMGLG
jgi:hypothetical protein